MQRLPYIKALDLRFWAALHAAVEKQHYIQNHNVNSLVNSVNEKCSIGKLDDIISKVILCLEKVL